MPSAVFVRQTLKPLSRLKISVKIQESSKKVQRPGNSEPAHLCTYDLFFMLQMTNQK